MWEWKKKRKENNSKLKTEASLSILDIFLLLSSQIFFRFLVKKKGFCWRRVLEKQDTVERCVFLLSWKKRNFEVKKTNQWKAFPAHPIVNKLRGGSLRWGVVREQLQAVLLVWVKKEGTRNLSSTFNPPPPFLSLFTMLLFYPSSTSPNFLIPSLSPLLFAFRRKVFGKFSPCFL